MIKKLLKLAFPIIVFSFLLQRIVQDWNLIFIYIQSINRFTLLLAVPVFLLVYPEVAVGWFFILQKLHVHISLKSAIRIWILASTSRYIPGMIWQYIGRVELAKRAGISRSKTSTSLFIEMFLALTAGILFSLIALPHITTNEIEVNRLIYLLPMFLLLFHPIFTRKILGMFARLSHRNIDTAMLQITFKDIVSLLPWYMANFLINGLALSLIIASLYKVVDLNQIIILTGFYALSWNFGFFSFFAPGGIGVMDATLALLLSFSMPLSLASLTAILYRFFLTVAEFLIFAIVLRIKD